MSGRCGGLHRPSRGAGGPGKAVVIVLVVVVIASAGRAVAPEALTGLEIALITISSVLAAAVVAGVTVLIVLARREALARRDDIRQLAPPAVRGVPAKRGRAIESPDQVYEMPVDGRPARARARDAGDSWNHGRQQR